MLPQQHYLFSYINKRFLAFITGYSSQEESTNREDATVLMIFKGL